MEKLIKFLNGEIIAVDKMLHFSFSFMIASLFINPWIAVTAVLVINILKELFDKYIKKTKFDAYDILSGLLGGLFYITTQYLLQ